MNVIYEDRDLRRATNFNLLKCKNCDFYKVHNGSLKAAAVITFPGCQERDYGTDPEFILILGTFRKITKSGW
jgi:hypothetical protein